MKIKKWKS